MVHVTPSGCLVVMVTCVCVCVVDTSSPRGGWWLGGGRHIALSGFKDLPSNVRLQSCLLQNEGHGRTQDDHGCEGRNVQRANGLTQTRPDHTTELQQSLEIIPSVFVCGREKSFGRWTNSCLLRSKQSCEVPSPPGQQMRGFLSRGKTLSVHRVRVSARCPQARGSFPLASRPEPPCGFDPQKSPTGAQHSDRLKVSRM